MVSSFLIAKKCFCFSSIHIIPSSFQRKKQTNIFLMMISISNPGMIQWYKMGLCHIGSCSSATFITRNCYMSQGPYFCLFHPKLAKSISQYFYHLILHFRLSKKCIMYLCIKGISWNYPILKRKVGNLLKNRSLKLVENVLLQSFSFDQFLVANLSAKKLKPFLSVHG